MKLVIEIPEVMFQTVKDGNWCGSHIIGEAICEGTPLPEHHGRLIDADAFQMYCYHKNFDKRLSDGGLATINLFLEFPPTIIERSESK